MPTKLSLLILKNCEIRYNNGHANVHIINKSDSLFYSESEVQELKDAIKKYEQQFMASIFRDDTTPTVTESFKGIIRAKEKTIEKQKDKILELENKIKRDETR